MDEQGLQAMNYIDVNEFIEEGYLQEVNRRFFHPLGLALVVAVDVDDDTGKETGPWRIAGVADHRDDPEGVFFDSIDIDKATHIERLEQERRPTRVDDLDFWIQPKDPTVGS